MRTVLKILFLLISLYGVLLAGFYLAMCLGPDFFGRVMAHSPNLVFAVFPFKTMWLSARHGNLKVGDAAPDFHLKRYDSDSRVRLSDLKGKRPVVLIFGSYT